MSDIDEIRARHEADANMYRDRKHDSAHADRATLLRALDAMAEENAMLREALFHIEAHLSRGLDMLALDRARAALKEID